MSIIPNTGGPTVSENADELDAKKAGHEKFIQDGINADFGKKAEGLMDELNMTEFDKDRAESAKAQVAKLEAKEGNPEADLFAQLEEVDGDKFDDPEIPENLRGIDAELYNPKTYSGQIRTRMAERFDTEEGGNAELLEAQLSTSEGRIKNKEQINNLFFGSDVLETSLSQLPEAEKKENLEWLKANTSEGGPLEESFERIKGNFVIPPELQGKSLTQIYEENHENSKIINDALADAILLEVADYTTQGKINHSEVAVKALIHDIKDINTSAIEKIRKFGEIHTIVNTGDGQGGKQQQKINKAALTRQARAAKANETFQAAQAQRLKPSPHHIIPVEERSIKEKGKPRGGDIFAASTLEIAKGRSEKTKETV